MKSLTFFCSSSHFHKLFLDYYSIIACGSSLVGDLQNSNNKIIFDGMDKDNRVELPPKSVHKTFVGKPNNSLIIVQYGISQSEVFPYY